MDAAVLDEGDGVVRHAVDLASALGFLGVLLVEQRAAALGDAEAGVGQHAGRVHLAFGGQHVLDERLHRLGLGRALADGVGLGPLDAAFLRHHRLHRRAIALQHTGDPVADAGHGHHLVVLEAVEGAAVIEEAADLRAQRHGGLLDLLPAGRVLVPQLGPIAVGEAHLAEIGQVPVEVAELALDLRLPEHLVGHRLVVGDGGGVVADAEVAEAHHHGIELAVLPVAGELLEVIIEHVVEGIIRRIHLLDVARRIQLLHELRIRQDDVIGAGGRLRDQRHHVVAARIILGLELHVVGGFELANHVGLAVAIPGQHVDLDRVGPGAADIGRAQGGGCGGRAIFENVAAIGLQDVRHASVSLGAGGLPAVVSHVPEPACHHVLSPWSSSSVKNLDLIRAFRKFMLLMHA